MNNVTLCGRLTKDPEIRKSQDLTIVSFTLAVDRRTKERAADFIRCTAFGSTAEFIDKYFAKGDGLTLRGHIQTGSYQDKDGNTVWTTDVICDDVEFPLSNAKREAEPEPEPEPKKRGYRR